MTISAENLSKRFNREWIFRDFTYTFAPGTYAIIGPNGSGKSTLLQVLWGQMPASAGIVRYTQDDTTIPGDAIYQYMGIVAPYVDLIDELTLSELIRFHFSFKKARGNQAPNELMDKMQLTHARDKQVGHFSSGMRQRLKLGLAFFSEVPLLYLDEPTMNLDRASIDWYWEQFNSLPAGVTVFVGSNHESEYPSQALRITITEYKKGLQMA